MNVMKGIAEWLSMFFLPTKLVYKAYCYMRGFEGYYVTVILMLGFLIDVAVGRGLFFTFFSLACIYFHFYIRSRKFQVYLYWFFSIVWILVVYFRGFSSIYVILSALVLILEVLAYGQKRRFVY